MNIIKDIPMALTSAQKFTEAKSKIHQILEDDSVTIMESFKYCNELQRMLDLMEAKASGEYIPNGALVKKE